MWRADGRSSEQAGLEDSLADLRNKVDIIAKKMESWEDKAGALLQTL